jgi:outer membrane protein OmpA-like peptidoglycan-associated protein
MNHWLCVMLVFAIFISNPSSSAEAQCEQATALYQKAVGQGVDGQEKIRLLEQSLEVCKSYAAFYELGKAYAVNGQIEPAIKALDNALGYAMNDVPKKIKVCQVKARVYGRYGKTDDAVLWYKTALKMCRQYSGEDKKQIEGTTKEIENELMELEKKAPDAIVTSAQIASTLSKGMDLTRDIAVVGVVPSVDLRVNFAYDSSALTDKGKRQVEELMKALTAPGFQGNRFKLVGHTDLRGTDEYNLQLSRNRAETVKTYLLQHSKIDPKRIDVEGRGKKEPLYSRNTEDAHALNRRVEVVIEKD